MEVYNKIKADLSIICLIIILIYLVSELFEIGYDSTDGDGRSGMSLHTDAMTHCQYLGGKDGGLTPRLSSSGKHICH